MSECYFEHWTTCSKSCADDLGLHPQSKSTVFSAAANVDRIHWQRNSLPSLGVKAIVCMCLMTNTIALVSIHVILYIHILGPAFVMSGGCPTPCSAAYGI